MTSLSARALGSLIQNWRTSGNGPAYAALADRIRLLVLDGRLSLGTRLPAERELAGHLGLSRTTVSAAYADLRSNWFPWTMPFNLTGHPAITLPCGADTEGLPIGLQIVGRFRADADLLRCAALFEATRGPLRFGSANA